MPTSSKHKPLSYDELMAQGAAISADAQKQQALERREIRQKRVSDMLNRSAVPRRYLAASLDDKQQAQAKAYVEAKAFVDGFDGRLKTGAGMLVWGDVGTGKTHLVCAIANALISQLRPVVYCTALEAVTLVRATWKRGNDGMTEYDVYARFGDPELLIIDEIGVQMGSDFERMVLTSIADIRSRNCRPTIIVSNLNPEDILGLVGERMFDRLVGFGANIVKMRGASMRMAVAQ
jgi:DNA replication protein DnaC